MALKIIFMGTPKFSVPILDSIHQSNHKIIEVYTQPPTKKNRGQKVHLSPVHTFSKKNNIPVRHPNQIDTNEELEHIDKLKADLVIVAAYGKILPRSLLNLKNLKFINIHASLLPKWRGSAPIHRAIMNSDPETGISIMKIVPKLDSGPVMMSSKIKIQKDTNYEILSDQLSKMGSELIIKSLKLLENNEEKFIEQNEKESTYAKKISKEESQINWNETASQIIAKINALHQNPGCWFNLDGLRIKVTKAIEVSGNGTPGEIIDENLVIACGKKAIKILELTRQGKQNMSASNFLKGKNIPIGTNLDK